MAALKLHTSANRRRRQWNGNWKTNQNQFDDGAASTYTMEELYTDIPQGECNDAPVVNEPNGNDEGCEASSNLQANEGDAHSTEIVNFYNANMNAEDFDIMDFSSSLRFLDKYDIEVNMTYLVKFLDEQGRQEDVLAFELCEEALQGCLSAFKVCQPSR